MALNLTQVLIEDGTGLVAGGAQRLLWHRSEMIGWISTGVLLVGGVIGSALFDRNPMMRDISRAASISGASTAGWVGTEKFILKLPPAFAQLPGGARQAALSAAQRAAMGGRVPVGAIPRAMAQVQMLRDGELIVL